LKAARFWVVLGLQCVIELLLFGFAVRRFIWDFCSFINVFLTRLIETTATGDAA